MAKDAFYFPHDSNAKDDPKCVMLIEQLGLEGYGIYWILIETLRDQPEYRYPIILIAALSRRYNTTSEKVKAVIEKYNLFATDGDFFYSHSLNKRMAIIDDKREKARVAINKRWAISKSQIPMLNIGNTSVIPPYNDSNTSKEKESKEKESNNNMAESSVSAPKNEELNKSLNLEENKDDLESGKQLKKYPPEFTPLRKQVFAGLSSRRGYSSKQPMVEAKAISQMLQEKFSPDQILNAYDCMKKQPFWGDKFLSMMSVRKDINEVLKNGKVERGAKEIRTQASQYTRPEILRAAYENTSPARKD